MTDSWGFCRIFVGFGLGFIVENTSKVIRWGRRSLRRVMRRVPPLEGNQRRRDLRLQAMGFEEGAEL